MKMGKVILRERDYEILAALEKWGILGLAQLDGLAFKKQAQAEERIRLFFNETNRRMYALACYKRLRDLELAGYVRGHFYLNQAKLHTLTEKGHRTLIEAGRARLPGFRGGMSEGLIKHELAVNAVGLMLTQIMGFEVRVERQRIAPNRVAWQPPAPTSIPVADLWVMDRLQPKALEVELTQKAESRYKAIWEAYHRRLPNKGVVLYLTAWPSGPETLFRLIDKFRADRVYVCSLQKFRETQGRHPFLSRMWTGDPVRLLLARAGGSL